MPASKYTQAQRDEALALYATDGPTAVTDKLGIPKQTVMGWAKKDGVRTVRTARTHAATQARSVDLKARRQELTELLLEDAHRLRAQLWQPTKVFAFGGKDNTYAEELVDEPTFTDKKNILGAVGIAVDRVVKLAAVDASADTGTSSGESLLDRLAADLHRRHADG